MDKKTGFDSRTAFWKASRPQGYQSTGLWACCNRYGDFSWIRRLVYLCSQLSVVKTLIDAWETNGDSLPLENGQLVLD